MGKRPYLDETLTKLKNNMLAKILTLNNNEVTEFVKNNKDKIIAMEILNETQWKSCYQDIIFFIKALIIQNNIKVNHKEIYNTLFNCKNKNDVMSLIKSNNNLRLDIPHNVAKYLIKIIKDEKKVDDSAQISLENPSLENGISNGSNPTNTLAFNNPNGNGESTTNETLTLANLKLLVENDQALLKKLLTSDDAKIHGILVSAFYDEYGISYELIDEFIKEVVRKHPEDEISSKKEIEKISLINKEHTDKINALEIELDDCKDKLFSLEDANNQLKIQLETALSQLQKYKSSSLKDEVNDLFSFNINDLSCFINNSTTDIQVNIRKSLMIKACEYVDAFNLLKTKNILTTEQSLPSEIIQIILLELFHEKNLL